MLEPLMPSTDKAGQPSLHALRFNTHGYLPQGHSQPGNVRIWRTPEGDGLGFYYIPVSPDLPANATSLDELAVFYRQLVEDSDGKLVEINVITVGGYPTVRTILSLPQEPAGRTYVGALTLPFRDFSFVIKCQCAEVGITGIKEIKLLARHQIANEAIQGNDKHFLMLGLNPDDPMYDPEFPEHPVARVRQVLNHIAGSLVVAEEVRHCPGFPLPQSR
jgi:hypothetical protein